mgnify:CR=1 FL=1
MKPVLYVYSRRGCHLCDVLVEELLPLVRGRMDVEVRDIDSHDDWKHAIYAHADVIRTLHRAEPVASHIKVDFELWGCPVNGQQVLAAVRQLLGCLDGQLREIEDPLLDLLSRI